MIVEGLESEGLGCVQRIVTAARIWVLVVHQRGTVQ
jgi:hypothetical protein